MQAIVQLFPMGPATSWGFMILVFALVLGLIWLFGPGLGTSATAGMTPPPAPLEPEIELAPVLYDYEKHGL